jgi:protein SCO1
VKLTSLQKALWALAIIAAIAFVWLLLWSDYRSDQARNDPAAAFHADFELTDHQGVIRSEQDFVGRWLLVFFGFANCPDVCPTTLAEVAAVMNALGDEARDVQPLFISIDPARDTPATLADFVPRFHPDIVGLTGTPEQIAQAAQTFKIYYEKITEAAAPGGYTMGHSSQLFLFSPSGGYVKS